MAKTLQGGIHLVEVHAGPTRELWVVTGSRDDAVKLVQQQLPSGQTAIKLSDRRLTPSEAAKFKLRGGEACKYD